MSEIKRYIEDTNINIQRPGQILDYVDTKEHLVELFNYITKLETENKLLKETKLAKQFPDLHCVEIKINTYKDIIDKAVDYIKQDYERNEEIVDYCAFKPFYNNLLKIYKTDYKIEIYYLGNLIYLLDTTTLDKKIEDILRGEIDEK